MFLNKLTPSFFFNFNYYKIIANYLVFIKVRTSIYVDGCALASCHFGFGRNLLQRSVQAVNNHAVPNSFLQVRVVCGLVLRDKRTQFLVQTVCDRFS